MYHFLIRSLYFSLPLYVSSRESPIVVVGEWSGEQTTVFRNEILIGNAPLQGLSEPRRSHLFFGFPLSRRSLISRHDAEEWCDVDNEDEDEYTVFRCWLDAVGCSLWKMKECEWLRLQPGCLSDILRLLCDDDVCGRAIKVRYVWYTHR